jgi:hypothetical protein
MSWKRTFNAPTTGLYQVVLPFEPGEWETMPITTSYAVPYSWHPDGTVRRVASYWDVQTAGTVTIDPDNLTVPDIIHELPVPEEITLHQEGDSSWHFTVNPNDWVETNIGLAAHRYYEGRPLNATRSSDFGVHAHALYWAGELVRLEIRWIACNPNDPIRRNYPFGSVWVGNDWDYHYGETIGDKMSRPWREDKLIYAVCNEWEDHGCGSNGVDYTKVEGGNVSDIFASVDYKKTIPWWESFWAQPHAAGSGGMHAGFGVCRLEIAAGLQAKNPNVWPALHYLGQEFITAQYHLIDSNAEPLEYPLNYPHSWSTILGGARGDLPHFGKGADAEPVTAPNHGTEPNSHMRSHTLSSIMEFAPTPMYHEELAGFRANAILNIYDGEERAYARTGYGALSILPFAQGSLRTELIDFISGRLRFFLTEYKKAGYRAHREDGPADKWIPGKKVFLPWQDQMFFGHVWSCHKSGYPELELTEDELNTATLTMKWFVDNCWQIGSDGHWQTSYATATDLSEHVWTDFGTGAQGIAGLEIVADYPRTALILADASSSPEYHRWYPQRPDSVPLPPVDPTIKAEPNPVMPEQGLLITYTNLAHKNETLNMHAVADTGDEAYVPITLNAAGVAVFRYTIPNAGWSSLLVAVSVDGKTISTTVTVLPYTIRVSERDMLALKATIENLKSVTVEGVYPYTLSLTELVNKIIDEAV